MTEDAVVETEVIEEPSEEIEAEATETEEEPQDQPDSSPDKEDAIQKRIDKATRKQRDAERDRDYWREMATKAEPVEKPVEKPQELEVKTLEDFDYDETKYQSYIFETARAQAVEAAKYALQEDKANNDTKSRQKAFQAKEKEYSKTVKDYMDVTRDTSLRLTKEMVDIASDADDGPALLYYLAKNPDISAAIAELSPLSAAREIGKLELKLLKEAKVSSKAPAPAPKIDGVNAGTSVKADSPDSDSLSMDDWLKRRNKQLAKR